SCLASRAVRATYTRWCRALQQAGHEVAFAVGPALRSPVEAAGFAVCEVRGTIASDPEYRQLKAHLHTAPTGLEREVFAYPRIFCGIASRLRTPQLVAIAKTWHPDMLIREAGEYSAVIAAEHLGLPHAVVAFAAALRSMTIFGREAAAQLDPIRERWGLPP